MTSFSTTPYLVLNERSSLDVGSGLVRDLHDELSLGLDAEVKDREIDSCSQIVDVRQKDVFSTFFDEFLHQS